MPKLAVLGQPVGHSRSPAMHNAALAELGLAPEWSYEAIEVAPSDFAGLVRSLPARGFAGVNVTVPHKLAALRVADEASSAASAIGAANTLSFAGGRIAAENTDATGILAALPVPPAGRSALVLGAGGSARAAAWALREAGATVAVWNRTAERAAALAADLGVAHDAAPQGPYELVVNATTVGLRQASNSLSGADAGAAKGDAGLKGLPLGADCLSAEVVLDLVYGDTETQLLRVARSAGARAVDGLEVLVRQGAAALAIWTGLEPPLDVMRVAARGAGA